MKIRPVQVELLHADGQTEGHDKANCRFSQFFENAWRSVTGFWSSVQVQYVIEFESPELKVNFFGVNEVTETNQCNHTGPSVQLTASLCPKPEKFCLNE